MARISRKSTTPVKCSSLPIGITMGTGLAFRRSIIIWRTRKKSAPGRSILLTNARRGTRYLLACRQTVSDCGCTPPTASYTMTAPSSTRIERSTSMVKSTCPGVSIILIRCSGKVLSIPCQKQVTAADVMVMPRSCSCAIQSVVAPPSCTSPSL
ncbi:Uncharacterised protein [Yersinia enterocolitica]|nr:Uncharacterised protein [Yersinia enterocolitica]